MYLSKIYTIDMYQFRKLYNSDELENHVNASGKNLLMAGKMADYWSSCYYYA